MALGPGALIHLDQMQSPIQKAQPSQPACRAEGKKGMGLRELGAAPSILHLTPFPLSGDTWQAQPCLPLC